MKCLFILKAKNNYGQVGPTISSGLFNSSSFINRMLKHNGVYSHIVEVVDANCINKEITQYCPEIVFIEALWVTPTKLLQLKELHPNIKFVVRIHSNTPFIANEGNAIAWSSAYLQLGIDIAPNSIKALNEFEKIVFSHKEEEHLIYLPNYYDITYGTANHKSHNNLIHIGCFGAIRPLKNQLIQAMAAIEIAKREKKELHFHINIKRIENNGDNVLKNIRSLFDCAGDRYTLIEHDWLKHEEFLHLVSQMDLGMQVSFSETFNIVSADFASQHVPLVVSPEIDWASDEIKADPTIIDDIIEKAEIALRSKGITSNNLKQLEEWNKKSKAVWLDFLR